MRLGSLRARSDSEFVIKFSLLDHVLRWRMKSKKRAAEVRFLRDYTLWKFNCEKNDKLSIERISKYNSELHAWTTRKINYDEEVHKTNEAVKDLRERYLQSDPEAVMQVLTYSLQDLEIPEIYSGQF